MLKLFTQDFLNEDEIKLGLARPTCTGQQIDKEEDGTTLITETMVIRLSVEQMATYEAYLLAIKTKLETPPPPPPDTSEQLAIINQALADIQQ